MFIKPIRLALALVVFFIGGMAAADTDIPISNPSFAGTPSPSGLLQFPDMPYWTQNGYFNGYIKLPIFGVQDIKATDNSKGIFSWLSMGCGVICPKDQSNSVSQVINGLVQGARYELSFFT